MAAQTACLFLLYVLFLAQRSSAVENPPPDSIHRPDQNAFATLLCDAETLPAVEALAQSIRIANHDEPFLIIVPSSVPDFVVGRINGLPNTHAFEADSLPYPFNSTATRMNIHKPCRFLKLQLWGLTRWRKILFLDADTIVRKNVAELFDAPGFSAVKDPVGMNYNTGVIVIEPSRFVYSLIINNYVHAGSYNVGDQGALNALIDFEAWNALPMRYNTFHTAPKESFEEAKIVHYSGDAKPWNFWKARGHGRIPTRAFVEWCNMAENTPTAACHMRGNIDYRQDDSTLKKRYKDSTDDKQLSVLLSTFSRDSWRELAVFYAGLDFVKEVYVVWQNMNKTREAAPHGKVKFVYPNSDSLNNRYLAADLSEDCVYICDDDIYVPAHSLRSGFEVWRQNPARLVGFYPRMWYPVPGSYSVNIASGYNIVLTKGMFAHRSFLTAYSLFLPKRLTRVVDELMNCEDILLNMLAVGMTGLPPLAVMSNETIHDVGKDKGISGPKGSTHLHTRDYCVQAFMRLGMDQPTLASRGSILPLARKNHVIGAGDD
ncbi:glycosyl transferase [Gracilaria domingensis]|nr:glycosyl transferase [Gracilaria domingensis]